MIAAIIFLCAFLLFIAWAVLVDHLLFFHREVKKKEEPKKITTRSTVYPEKQPDFNDWVNFIHQQSLNYYATR